MTDMNNTIELPEPNGFFGARGYRGHFCPTRGLHVIPKKHSTPRPKYAPATTAQEGVAV